MKPLCQDYFKKGFPKKVGEVRDVMTDEPKNTMKHMCHYYKNHEKCITKSTEFYTTQKQATQNEQKPRLKYLCSHSLYRNW